MTEELMNQANEYGIQPSQVNTLVGDLQSQEIGEDMTKQYEQIIRMDIRIRGNIQNG